MQNKLQDYISPKAITQVLKLLEHDHLVVKIKNERKTRHGDYMRLANGKHQITINSNLNEYRFLITLIHEIAHFEAYNTYGRFIKPHGIEWKKTFQHLMLPFLNPEIFPNHLLPMLAKHFKNPKASSDSDAQLALALIKPLFLRYLWGILLSYTMEKYLKKEKNEQSVLNVLKLKQENCIFLTQTQKLK
jgi:SprT protein